VLGVGTLMARVQGERAMAEERSLKAILQSIREIYTRRAEIDIVDKSGATRPTPVYFVCSKCALLHTTIQIRQPKVKAGRIDCLECGELVHQWSGGFYDFTDWQPVRLEAV